MGIGHGPATSVLNSNEVVLPHWVSENLFLWYWQLRVEKPKGARRRNLYRWIAKEKLRIAETGVDQQLIDAVCKYLSGYSVVSRNKMLELMNRGTVQFCLDFAA